MTDIVERLQDAAAVGADLSPGDPLASEAAAEIERLRASLVVYADSANWGSHYGHNSDIQNQFCDPHCWQNDGWILARAALGLPLFD